MANDRDSVSNPVQQRAAANSLNKHKPNGNEGNGDIPGSIKQSIMSPRSSTLQEELEMAEVSEGLQFKLEKGDPILFAAGGHNSKLAMATFLDPRAMDPQMKAFALKRRHDIWGLFKQYGYLERSVDGEGVKQVVGVIDSAAGGKRSLGDPNHALVPQQQQTNGQQPPGNDKAVSIEM